MIVLGLLLLLASGALALAVVTSNTESTSVAAFGYTVSDLSLGLLFAAGVLTGLLLMLGVSLLLSGLSRSRALRARARRARAATSENERLQEENEALRAKLDDEADADTEHPVEPYAADPYDTDNQQVPAARRRAKP